MAACFAAKGHEVVGVDLLERNVRLINEGKAPVFEPGLQELLDRAVAGCAQPATWPRPPARPS